MSDVWLVLGGTLTGAVGPGISVLYATYGELITERAGRINLGTEGSMLMGASGSSSPWKQAPLRLGS